MVYKLGTIYRIICLPNPDIQYVGSTFDNLSQRWKKHQGHYREYLNKKARKGIAIYKYFDEYGIQNFKIIKIKQYLVYQEHKKDRLHLEMYETLWINKIKCCNIIVPFQIKFISNHSRYIKNKSKYSEYNKARRNGPKREQILAQKREYCQKNKEKISAKKKETYTCECGSTLTKAKKKRHEQSKKHLSFFP
jgi:hypothetical protein